MRRLLAAIFIGFSLALTGCMSVKSWSTEMPHLQGDPAVTMKGGKSIFLVTATIRNSYKDFQPDLQTIHLDRRTVSGKPERINLAMDERGTPSKSKSTDSKRYLIRFELAPGDYVLKGMVSTYHIPIVVNAIFATPVHSDISVGKPGIYYLGHIEGTVRERQGDEFRAGPPLLIIDQALVGASGGTFDVVIDDDFIVDGPLFQQAFPSLKNMPIEKQILAPFDRARAQKWWIENDLRTF